MHFKPFQEDSTENITFRMAAVWRHVAQNYGGYEWYARFWDDNYVVVKDFEDIIKGHNPNLPIEIGRLADFSTNQLIRVGEERNHPLSALLYVDGGAGSMLSREAMRRLTVGMDICIEEVDPKVFTCAWRCEVLYLKIYSSKNSNLILQPVGRNLRPLHANALRRPVLPLPGNVPRQHRRPDRALLGPNARARAL